MKSVLLVIDIQDKTTSLLFGKKDFLDRVNSIIDYFKNKKLPIIYVKQSGAGNLSNKLHYDLSDCIVTKEKPSSFSSKEFSDVLQTLKVSEIVVTGLMSNACIQATCKSALNKKFEVTLIEDGHDSIIKPFRNLYNKKLKKSGVNIVMTQDFLNR